MKRIYALLLFISLSLGVWGQSPFNADTVKAGRFDNGKMWTFDFPPVDYFQQTYGFKPTQQWLDDVRMSALRFASWCSASFVSPDGLVMTNHHCARESGTSVQRPGEDFNNNGFVAASYDEERKVPDLYVDQLVKMEDITTRVQKAMEKGTTDEEKVKARTDEFAAIRKEYAEKDGWKGLQLQTITFYWGGKYSLYGFKRYNDVRLVAMPELALGFFGGDYDNFTYPRYCLDFSFFRVYGDDGKPLKTNHYFKFNPKGAQEGEPVFVIGNPGSTNRQGTVAILDYFKTTPWPTTLKRFGARSKILQEYNKTAKSDSILNEIFGLENTLKAIGGMKKGLEDPYIFARRAAFEREFKAAVDKNPKLKPQAGIWDEIKATQGEIQKNYYEAALLAPVGLNSDAYDQANLFYGYATAEPQRAEQMKQPLTDFKKPGPMELEKKYLAQHFRESMELLGPNHPYTQALNAVDLKKFSAKEFPKNMNMDKHELLAEYFLKNSKVFDAKFRAELMEKGPQAILESNDPLLTLARISGKHYKEAAARNQANNARLATLRSKLALLLFEVYGTSIPPDATFSLRIADGVVKGYDYNGTRAPYKTTFYGLYDRYYSFDKNYPWDLPAKWQNPPAELLDKPVNFVSTNDIIGGNSGSPMINQNKEVVGLIFDGNMESLPGNYIFMPETNRTVSVHAGGIVAGLKYIYKSDRLVNELLGSK
ncbi:MAG: S46 family peptidase [Cyclobacteriaceae bacterium]|nr:S46 family peptidase [Cyclobacteriaceae bacterium]